MSFPETYTTVPYPSNGINKRPDVPREFFVSVELYLSPKAASGLRKPHLSRKKNDKRDSIKQSSNASDDSPKKLREKTSRPNVGRGSPTAGLWRAATCKLSEEEEGCLLNIYLDETILHQSIYVYLLNHTDIRQVDQSLFDRKDCIVIQCAPGQRWSTTASTEPIFLSFSNHDTFGTWMTLLRSYATPEIYGQRINPVEGGLYRMWRQIEVNCIQGRNLGMVRPSTTEGGAGTSEIIQDPEIADHDIFCEVYLNDLISGRTTAKKSSGSHDWHEGFLITDLPPFENLEIIVFREKKAMKTIVLGNVVIALGNFRRGEYVEGWFPVLDNPSSNVGIQVGEMRLKIKVDEELILPHYEYAGIIQTLKSRNYLDWMNDLGTKLQLKDVSTQFISVAVAMNTLVESICELADREVGRTPISQNTLFRGNTVLTKTIELYMMWYGKAFLESSIGTVIRKIYKEKVAIEIDPARGAKNTKDIERNMDLLVSWCSELWKSIYAVRSECPHELRKLFEHIRKLVEQRHRALEPNNDQPSDLPWQSVSAFVFLRFMVPAILHPHLFGLAAGLPDLPVQRSLTLIAKVVQSLANLNPTVQKEEFMRGMEGFLVSSRTAMVDYIFVVSSPGPEPHGPHSTIATSEQHSRLRAIDSLRQRGNSMPLLQREAIPLLPYLLDVPKHLAVISSAVIRRSRGYQGTPKADSTDDPDLTEFCGKCYEIEEHALRRVSRLAGRLTEVPRPRSSTGNIRGRSSSVGPSSPRTSVPPSPLRPGPKLERQSSKSSTRTSPRPFTAPDPTDTLQPNPPALPLPQPPGVTSYSRVEVSGSHNTSRLRQSSTPLRRVQTAEDSSPTRDEETTQKRKGFFRTFLSRK